jgi:cytochrome c
MKKNACVLGLAVALFVSMVFSVFASEETEKAKKKAMDLIDKGIAYINKAGKEKAFKDFTDKNGGFVDGEFYIFVVDFKGLTLAHGGNPALVGQSMFELKDSDGKLFIQEFIKLAKEKGEGWVDYKWSNPTTKKVEPKSTYIKTIKGADYFLGCGIYLEK